MSETKEIKKITADFKGLATRLGVTLGNGFENQDKAYFNYVKDVLKHVQSLNKPSLSNRTERDKIRQDLDDLERCYCKTQSFDGNEQGANNGYRPNMEEQRQITKIELREKLKDLLLESMIKDKQNEEMNQIIKDMVSLIPNDTQQEIIKSHYLLNISMRDICYDMSRYSNNIIFQYRQRGIKEIVKILKKYS